MGEGISEQERYKRTCLSKKGYKAKSVALCAADKAIRAVKKRLSPYKCPYCGAWHLTTQRPCKRKAGTLDR